MEILDDLSPAMRRALVILDERMPDETGPLSVDGRTARGLRRRGLVQRSHDLTPQGRALARVIQPPVPGDQLRRSAAEPAMDGGLQVRVTATLPTHLDSTATPIERTWSIGAAPPDPEAAYMQLETLLNDCVRGVLLRARGRLGLPPTSGGVEVTEELVERLAAQAERGYTVEQLRPEGDRRG